MKKSALLMMFSFCCFSVCQAAVDPGTESRRERPDISDGASTDTTRIQVPAKTVHIPGPFPDLKITNEDEKQAYLRLARTRADEWEGIIAEVRSEARVAMGPRKESLESSARYMEDKLASVRTGIDRIETAKTAEVKSEEQKVQSDLTAMRREYGKINRAQAE